VSESSIREPAPVIPATPADPTDLMHRFRGWQWRILIAALIGYTLYYFVRRNFSIALPAMLEDLQYTRADLGIFITLHGLLYGLSKLFNGVFVDRLNARWFMVGGLVVSALLNIAFGLSTSIVALGIIWTVNGWVQGFGFPPAARLMTHWFSPRELATKMSLWNTSHAIGAALVAVLCGYLVAIGGWRLCFHVPAAIALAGAIYLALALRETPESLGFPEVEGTAQPGEAKLGVWQTLTRHVFTNPYIWLISLANFFVYIVRFGMLEWGPTYLKQAKGFTSAEAGWTIGAIEFASIFGMVLSGWITDRVFAGRGIRTCFFCMVFCAAALFAFQLLPEGTPVLLEIALLVTAGFFMYGPQALIGIIAANLATKKAAATAGGLTGFFGYLSAVPAGWGVGALVDRYGWNAGYDLFVASAVAGAIVFACGWRGPAHGYAK
jgi:sugar phosphate permease